MAIKLDNEFEMADMVIEAYKKECPEGWITFFDGMEAKRKALYDPKFGRWKGKETGEARVVAKFPNDKKGNNLFTIIKKFIPDIDDEKKFERFLKAHPEFRVPEKL